MNYKLSLAKPAGFSFSRYSNSKISKLYRFVIHSKITLKVIYRRPIGLHEFNIIWILNYSFFEPIEGENKGDEFVDRQRELSCHFDFVVVEKLGARSNILPFWSDEYDVELQMMG